MYSGWRGGGHGVIFPVCYIKGLPDLVNKLVISKVHEHRGRTVLLGQHDVKLVLQWHMDLPVGGGCGVRGVTLLERTDAWIWGMVAGAGLMCTEISSSFCMMVLRLGL